MYRSAYKPIFEELNQRLAREGVYVGKSADYPRVEVHTIVENQPTDKGDSVRVLSCVLESMSTTSMEEAATMNGDNLEVLDAFRYEDEQFRVVGVVFTGMNEMTETSDTQMILYRVIQNADIYVQQL